MKSLLLLVFAAVFLFSSLDAKPSLLRHSGPHRTIPSANLGPAPYAQWAHSHWVWLHNDLGSTANVRQLVADYQAHNIEVGAVDIDSEWETDFNTFIFDESKFSNISGVISSFADQGIRTICWITSMVNVDSPNYQEGKDNDYYVKGFDGKDTMKWWHGEGSLLDYTYENARTWWEKQMDITLATGIHGWKADATDPYIIELIAATGHDGRFISYREYADWYYGHFFNYTRSQIGFDALLMSRPVDSMPADTPYFHLAFSPRYAVFSGWVGDQDPSTEGMENALRNMFESAKKNYVGFGSDIGGYRTDGSALGRSKEIFIRWAQMGAFVSLMENGGGGEHRPWMFDDETVEIYRNFVDIHYSLMPFFYTAGTEAWYNGNSIMQPEDGQWAYRLSNDIFVVAMPDYNNTNVKFTFPSTSISSGDSWSYWFNTDRIYKAGETVEMDIPFNEFPVFQRTSSAIPMYLQKLPLVQAMRTRQIELDLVKTEAVRKYDYFPVSFVVVHPAPGAIIEKKIYDQQLDHEEGPAHHGPGLRFSFRRSEDGSSFEAIVTSHAKRHAHIILKGVERIDESTMWIVDGLRESESIFEKAHSHDHLASLIKIESLSSVWFHDQALKELHIVVASGSLSQGVHVRGGGGIHFMY